MTPRNETDLLDQTVELAMMTGWHVSHQRPARTLSGWRTSVQGHIGFPDLVLARAGVLLLRELKGHTGRLTPEQQQWAGQLCPGWFELRTHLPDDETRLLFDVWRPEHWDTRIVPTLTARAVVS